MKKRNRKYGRENKLSLKMAFTRNFAALGFPVNYILEGDFTQLKAPF